MDALESGLIAVWVAVHLCGLVAAWVSRWELSPLFERVNQVFLSIAFLSIACLAVFHLPTAYQLSLLSATTLAAMAVGAVCELGADDEDQLLRRVVAAYE